MRNKRSYLFTDYDLRRTLDGQFEELQSEVNSMNDDRFLNTSENDMIKYLEEKYIIEPIVFNEGGISVDQVETDIDVSNNFDRDIRDRSRPHYVKGTANKFYVPFSGDDTLFKCQPSSYTSTFPTAKIIGGEVVFMYNTTKHDPAALRSQFDRDFDEVKKYAGWVEKDVISHNSSVKNRVIQIVTQRREKILANRGLASSLGFPMRERTGSPKTYSVPEVRRKPPIRPPVASSEPFSPEPALDSKEYEHILSVIDNMVLVMERSPHAFSGMGEEDIRQHFLVQLNGHYEGQATGETFNFDGKTDILIRADGRNIFIAECKFWKGPNSLLKTIDQLLGYTTWKDTKTAILVFNRNKSLSTVLEKILPTLESHPNFKSLLDSNRDYGWRAIFGHRDDPAREIIVAVHVYEVPS